MKQKTRRRLQNIGVIIVIASALVWIVSNFIEFSSSASTDNAQVFQRIVPVNSRVQGFVKEVRFDDYMQVRKGDTLAIIDDSDLRLQLAQAKANLRNALSGKEVANSVVSTSTNDISVTMAALAEVETLLHNARRDLDRYAALLASDAVTQQQYDAVETNYLALEAKRNTLLQQKNSTGLVAEQQRRRIGQNDAGIELAQAAVSVAELNLSYTVILAPCDGYTARRDIQPGQLIQPGQTVVSIVDTADTWVIANYKETQLSRMAIGDSVDIKVDAVPGVAYRGVIEAISNATGAKYSIIPQDNSTGNFVKVNQRIPVKIRFAPSTPGSDMEKLRSGMNVECKVIM
ncbi:MAG: HlyD family secretion protein [Muribaculaceae bacterium]|nr:HlyD family secretion protein [Muribaculaceae bacterium]